MSSYINDNDYNDEISIDDLMHKLFSKKPSSINENKIIPTSVDENDIKDGILIYGFEMLLNIYIAGIFHHEKLKYILKNKFLDEKNITDLYNDVYDDLDIQQINEELLLIPSLWFESICYSIRVDEYNYDDFFEIEDNKNHYCKIMLKSNVHDMYYFEYMNIEKPYHFLINGKFSHEKIVNLNDVYAILIKNNNKNKMVYKIYFKEINNIDQHIKLY